MKYINETDQTYTETLWDTLEMLTPERAPGEDGLTALEKQGIKIVNWGRVLCRITRTSRFRL